MLFTQSSITVDPRLSPLGTCVFGFLHGGLVDESLINFMVVGHIPLELILPLSYVLILHIQAIGVFSSERTSFRYLVAAFLSQLYRALITSQIATVTCLCGCLFNGGLSRICSSRVGASWREAS